MKVSIIVPVYNVEDYLDECVNSMINQTMQDIQIILVDDGSSDRSGKMIDDYAVSDNRVVALHKENGGQSSARNLGLKHASGEYVLYVDSDDYIVPNACERLYETAVRFDADIVHGDLENEEKLIMDNPSFRKIPSENQAISTKEFLKEKVQTETYDIVPVLYLVRRSLIEWEKLTFPEGYFYEDQLYTFQLLTVDATIIKIRFPFYFYRMDRPGSTTNHMSLKKGLDAAFICNEMLRHLELQPTEMREYNNTICLISLYQYYRAYLRMKRKDRTRVWNAIDFPRAYSVARNCVNYKHLTKELDSFVSNRALHVLRWDIKWNATRLARKILRKG